MKRDATYRLPTGTINALTMVEGEKDYATFIDNVNAIIERQKVILKARKTFNSKKEEEDGERPGEL